MGEPLSGVFVTGTGTEVGKTVVAAALARTLAAAGRRVAVFKPAVTGLEEAGEADHELLRRASGSAQSDEEIAPYRYRPPVSPHQSQHRCSAQGRVRTRTRARSKKRSKRLTACGAVCVGRTLPSTSSGQALSANCVLRKN